ncbi:MAG TPA: hypothetical protein VL281_12945 [Mycobacteriales bacterium]|jgi:hypothetical protein|nr:hypothetical protein [Mycobacteriales bacterium]
MNRRLTSAVALLAVAALSSAPAHAATKKKPKPIRGSYAVHLNPDPTTDVFSEASQKNPTGEPCGLSTASEDRHAFKVPAAGTLHVVLDSPNPLPANYALGPDWDLHIMDADGSELDASTSPEAHEETTDKFKKAQPLTILVCNLTGGTDAKVSYTFTFA